MKNEKANVVYLNIKIESPLVHLPRLFYGPFSWIFHIYLHWRPTLHLPSIEFLISRTFQVLTKDLGFMKNTRTFDNKKNETSS